LTEIAAEVAQQQPTDPNTPPPSISRLSCGSSYDVVNDTAEVIMRMLTEANNIALGICPTAPVHSKGRLHNRCGTASKKYKQAKATGKVLAQWAAAPTDEVAAEVVTLTKAAHAKQLIEAHQAEHACGTHAEIAAALRK
jgi:hypothetical protein